MADLSQLLVKPANSALNMFKEILAQSHNIEFQQTQNYSRVMLMKGEL